MKLKLRALEAWRPAIWALAAVFALTMAPAATAKSPSAGPDGGARGSDRPSEWPAGPVALGTGFRSPDASERVREVQRRLNRLGYGTGAVDGLFGPRTQAAVRRFQGDGRLAVDGVVGRRTLGHLRFSNRQQERLLARGSGLTRSGPSERVREVQRRLNRLGYRAGAVDGLFGPRTQAAVLRFQGDGRLAVDGVVGPRTQRALGSPSQPARSRIGSERRRSPSREVRSEQAPTQPKPAERAPTQPKTAVPSPQPEVPIDGPASVSTPLESGPRWEVILPLGAFIVLMLVIAFTLRSDDAPPRDEIADREGLPVTGPDPLEAWKAELVDVPDAKPLVGVGVRADLAGSPESGTSSGTVYVAIELFAEGHKQRWETDPLDGGAPFSVSVEALERSVREIVVPGRLAVLARTLRNAGMDVQPGDLERLPFMLELSPELEGELVRRRLRVTA